MRISDKGMKMRRVRWVVLLAAALVGAVGGCYEPLHEQQPRPAAVPRPSTVPQSPH